MSGTSTEWAELSLYRLYIHSIKKRKQAMRFVWVIFVVFLGYADAQPLKDDHPVVDKCFNLAVDCKHQCLANNARHQYCVEQIPIAA
ncbi:hypothetical protein Q1695_003849 [Nippostrongylus brasiliensis]|nr:hypothetical protein Q1695_003849 [Nippostrongylus brasiliensis]